MQTSARFEVKKLWIFFKFMVCPHGQGYTFCGQEGSFFLILCGHFLWTASSRSDIKTLHTIFNMLI